MPTRISKIARLPKDIREQLNQRLENGEKGKTLVRWLNSLPEVQKIITEQFAGHAIREQNLSDWKHGGYTDWLHHQQLRELIRWNTETATDLDSQQNDTEIADTLGTFLAAELVLHARALPAIKDPDKRWRRFRQVARELSRIRRDDHRFDRNLLHREQWESTLEPLEQPELEQDEVENCPQTNARIDPPNQSPPETSSPSPPRSGGEGRGEVVLGDHGDGLEKQDLDETEPDEKESDTDEPEAGGASVPASPEPQNSEPAPTIKPETQPVRQSLGGGGNPKLEAIGGASLPASPETQNPIPRWGETPSSPENPQPETPGTPSVPASHDIPKPQRKKLFSDTSYRSLRQPHYFDQLSG